MEYHMDLQVDVDYNMGRLNALFDFALKFCISFSLNLVPRKQGYILTKSEENFLRRLNPYKIKEEDYKTPHVPSINARRIYYKCNNGSIKVLKNQFLNRNTDKRLSVMLDHHLQDPQFYDKKGKELISFIVHESWVTLNLDEEQEKWCNKHNILDPKHLIRYK